jgi:hypothetical protein
MKCRKSSIKKEKKNNIGNEALPTSIKERRTPKA